MSAGAGERAREHGRLDVVHLTNALTVGGLERLVVSFANDSARRGLRVAVLGDGRGRLWDELDANVSRLTLEQRPGRVGRVVFLMHVARHLAAIRPRIIHSHQRSLAVVANLLSAILRVKHIEHVHNIFVPPSHTLTSFRSRVIVACGAIVKTVITDLYRREPGRVRVVRNGVPDLGPLAFPDQPGRLRLLAVGRLSEQKNPEQLVRLVAALRDTYSLDVDAVWVGEGPLRDDVEALITQLAVAENMKLVGESDPQYWYGWCQVVVILSRWEGLPLVAVESLAAGRGLIAVDVGGVREVVATDRGLLLDSEITDEDLAAATYCVLNHDVLAGWGAHARAAYEKEWTEQRMLDELDQVYRELLGRG